MSMRAKRVIIPRSDGTVGMNGSRARDPRVERQDGYGAFSGVAGRTQ